MKRIAFYTAVLVGTYLAVAYATGAGTVISAAGNTYTGAVRALQGR